MHLQEGFKRFRTRERSFNIYVSEAGNTHDFLPLYFLIASAHCNE